MEQKNKSIQVKTTLTPVFYKNFHCLANKCRDTCCEGWVINFDKKDFLRLRRLDAPAELKERLSKGVRRMRGKLAEDGRMYGYFDLPGNQDRCPFFGEDGLCDIHRTCGHEALPYVCTSYPRRVTYTPAAKEYSLSPSCEGVLERLWEIPEGVKFIEEPLPKTDYRSLKIDEETELMQYFAPVRRVLIDILQNRAFSLTERMLYLGLTVQRLQKEDYKNFDPEKWGQQTIALMNSDMMGETLGKITGNRKMYLMQNLKVLEVISRTEKKAWVTELFDALEVGSKVALVQDENNPGSARVQFWMDYSMEDYENALAEFEKAFADREYFFENLMVAAALYLDFPTMTSPEGIWKSYVSLCNLYSFYRFSAVLGCKGNTTKEQLFHILAMASRVILHNKDRFQGFQEELFQHESSTLAHMAILLNG